MKIFSILILLTLHDFKLVAGQEMKINISSSSSDSEKFQITCKEEILMKINSFDNRFTNFDCSSFPSSPRCISSNYKLCLIADSEGNYFTFYIPVEYLSYNKALYDMIKDSYARSMIKKCNIYYYIGEFCTSKDFTDEHFYQTITSKSQNIQGVNVKSKEHLLCFKTDEMEAPMNITLKYKDQIKIKKIGKEKVKSIKDKDQFIATTIETTLDKGEQIGSRAILILMGFVLLIILLVVAVNIWIKYRYIIHKYFFDYIHL